MRSYNDAWGCMRMYGVKNETVCGCMRSYEDPWGCMGLRMRLYEV